MSYYRILLVDDEPHMIQMLLRLLDEIEDADSDMDLDVYYAYNAVTALDYIRKGPIDLMVTDIKMPGMTGLELLEEVNRCQETKTIMLTAYPDFQYAYEAFRKKAVSYLLKTEEPEVIKSTILRELDQIRQERRLAKYEETVPETPQDKTALTRSSMVVKSLKDYIDSHVADDVSLIRLSEITGYNSSYISWLFHNETGEKLNRYIGKRKMELIDRHMRNPLLTIDEIIEKTGFHSRRNFNIFIKRETGMAPGEYRKQLQEAGEKRGEEKC